MPPSSARERGPGRVENPGPRYGSAVRAVALTARALFANTSYAKLAQEFLASLPPEARKQDFEKEARGASATPSKNERQ